MLDFEFLKNLGWVVLFAAALVLVFVAGKRGYFDKAKFSKDGTKYKFDQGNWRKFFPVVAAVLLLAFGSFMLSGCSSGSTEPAVPTVTAFNCQGSYVGNVDMPPHEERIAARNEGLKRKGLPLTGNDAVDNRAQGGGDPDGGMWLTGNFDFQADAACKVTGTVAIFGYPFALNGVIQPDGTFTLDYLVPLFVGKVNPDNTVTGKLMHGGGEEYIYGYINGRFTPVAK